MPGDSEGAFQGIPGQGVGSAEHEKESLASWPSDSGSLIGGRGECIDCGTPIAVCVSGRIAFHFSRRGGGRSARGPDTVAN
jgi:hypothetical protein